MEQVQRRFISNMIYRNRTGQAMEMNQNMYFDYLYIDDLVPILEWFLTHEPRHHHYNVYSGQRFELLSLARIVMEETGIFSQIAAKQEGLKPEYTGDNSRLRKELDEIALTPMGTVHLVGCVRSCDSVRSCLRERAMLEEVSRTILKEYSNA